MRHLGAQFLAAFLSLTMIAAAKSPFAGTWKGKINDLPAADLTIEDAGGKLSGVVVFYFQLRGADGKWSVANTLTEPLLALKLDGKNLIFEVSHRNAHPGASSDRDPNVKYRLELTSMNESRH